MRHKARGQIGGSTMATATANDGKWRRRWRARGDAGGMDSKLAWLSLALVVASIFGALLAGFGTGQGWWSYAEGLKGLLPAFTVAIIGTLIALFARVFRRGGKGVSLFAFLLGAAFVAYLGNYARIAKSVPAIHDATTDLQDPPIFYHLVLRPDNMDKIPDTDRPGWAALPPLERWRALHAEAYPDLKPLNVALAPKMALAKAEAVVRASGWAIAAVDQAQNQVEATATTRFYKFKDDVVVRVRPSGAGSVIDLRSVSRVGLSDLGANAERIRIFQSRMAQP